MRFLPPYPAATRRAVEARLRDTDDAMTAIAAETGIAYDTIRSWNARMRVPARWNGRRPPDPATLTAALRGHVALRIAALERGLRRDRTREAGSALRDLFGLKRLLDELDADAARQAGRAGSRAPQGTSDGDADGRPPQDLAPQDLAALRADLARRYATFEAEWERGAVPGAPGSPPSDASEG